MVRHYLPKLITAAVAGLLLLAACAPGRPVAVPEDGVLRVSTPQTRLAVAIPEAQHDTARLLPDGTYMFGKEMGPTHTLLATVSATVVEPSMWPAFQVRNAGATEAEMLEDYLQEMEPLERASPGRPSNTLLSFTKVGGARAQLAAQGIACNERALVALDHDVPGQGGRSFVYYASYYTCIDPTTHAPVELGWSERLPDAPERPQPRFAGERDAFFDSLRFE